MSASDQKRLSMILKKICYEHQRLPPSYTITGKLDRTGEYPIGGGRNADVWRGVYRGSQVAIKVLRVNVGTDLVNLERVRPLVYLFFNKTRRVLTRAG